MRLIDCHCHLGSAEFEIDIDDVITRAQSAGVENAIVVSETVDDFTRTLELSDQYSGLHPVQGKRCVTVEDWKKAEPILEKHSQRIVAVGEIGLDFTPWICKTQSDREQQEYVFRSQIQFAERHKLAVNIHSRSAAKRVLEILVEEGASQVLLHNFAGKPSLAELAHKHGFYMSFPPIVSTKPERNKLLSRVPLGSLCLETDSPALGCDPTVRNEPAEILQSCRHIAKVKGQNESLIAEFTTANAKNLFLKTNHM